MDDAVAYFDWPVRVYYEDTDAAGMVFYANYLRFLERGRTEWLRALGVEQDQLRAQQGVAFGVRRAELEYLAPALFNDQLTVRSRICGVGGASIDFEQGVLRPSDQRLCCQARIKIACIDAHDLRARRIPHDLALLFRSCMPEAAAP